MESGKTRIGDILIEDGVINASQLAKALRFQKENGVLLGMGIVKLGFATHERIALALERQAYLRSLESQGLLIRQPKHHPLIAFHSTLRPLFLTALVLAALTAILRWGGPLYRYILWADEPTPPANASLHRSSKVAELGKVAEYFGGRTSP